MMCCFVEKLKNLIFPLRGSDLEDPAELSLHEIASQISSETDHAKLTKMYEVITQIAASERERDESIVRRSTSFLAAVTILSALVLGFGLPSLIKPIGVPLWAYVIFCILYICILVCFSVSVLSAIRTIETEKFYVVGAEEASKISAATEIEYLKKLLEKMVEYTERNYRVTNNRATRYAYSWQYLSWGIFLLFMFGLLRILFFEYMCG